MKRGQFWCYLSVTAKKTSFPGSPLAFLRVHTNLDGSRRKKERPWGRGLAEQCPTKSRGCSFPFLGMKFFTQRKELILGFHVTSRRPCWCTEQQRKVFWDFNWLYYYAKFERSFAIVLNTNMAVSSREWNQEYRTLAFVHLQINYLSSFHKIHSTFGSFCILS